MSSVDGSGISRLGDVPVERLGYSAMQLSGPGLFGPFRNRKTAVAVGVRPSRLGSTTSTPATITGRTSRIN